MEQQEVSWDVLSMAGESVSIGSVRSCLAGTVRLTTPDSLCSGSPSGAALRVLPFVRRGVSAASRLPGSVEDAEFLACQVVQEGGADEQHAQGQELELCAFVAGEC